jgi:hypothetical protein
VSPARGLSIGRTPGDQPVLPHGHGRHRLMVTCRSRYDHRSCSTPGAGWSRA